MYYYYIVPFNALKRNGSKFIFLTEDPIIEIVGDFLNATYIEIEYSLKIMDEREILSFANSKVIEDTGRLNRYKKTIEKIKGESEGFQKKNEELIREKEELIREKEELIREKEELIVKVEAIKNTRGYRVLEKMRQIRRKLNE